MYAYDTLVIWLCLKNKRKENNVVFQVSFCDGRKVNICENVR